MRKLLFENETCSRCGGCGQYSYCQMYGTRCFKCGGDGVTLTKRGKTAQLWFNAKKMKPASEVKIGDRVVYDGVPGFSKTTVVTVDFVGYPVEGGSKWLCNKTGEWKPHFQVNGKNVRGENFSIGGFENTDIKMFVSGDALVALRAEAKAYEASLTKAGTVRKKGRK